MNWQVGLLTGSSIPTISWLKVATAALVVVPDMAVVTLGYLVWVVKDCGIERHRCLPWVPSGSRSTWRSGFDVAGLGRHSQCGAEWNSLAFT